MKTIAEAILELDGTGSGSGSGGTGGVTVIKYTVSERNATITITNAAAVCDAIDDMFAHPEKAFSYGFMRESNGHTFIERPNLILESIGNSCSLLYIDENNEINCYLSAFDDGNIEYTVGQGGPQYMHSFTRDDIGTDGTAEITWEA